MIFIKSLFLLLIVALIAPASASIFFPADTIVNSVVGCSVAANEVDSKEVKEEEEPDCE